VPLQDPPSSQALVVRQEQGPSPQCASLHSPSSLPESHRLQGQGPANEGPHCPPPFRPPLQEQGPITQCPSLASPSPLPPEPPLCWGRAPGRQCPALPEGRRKEFFEQPKKRPHGKGPPPLQGGGQHRGLPPAPSSPRTLPFAGAGPRQAGRSILSSPRRGPMGRRWKGTACRSGGLWTRGECALFRPKKKKKKKRERRLLTQGTEVGALVSMHHAFARSQSAIRMHAP